MNARNRMAPALLAVILLAWVPAVYAADNGTEFGIEDDLTVGGTEGTWADPDVELKGFTIFGDLSGPQNISAAPGNLVLRGNLQADATAYFGSSVTIAGYGVFQSTVQMTEGNLKYGSGASGKVLKSIGNGYVYWGDDVEGAGEIAGTPRRLVMFQADGTGGAESQLQQDPNDTSITMLAGSSMTIQGAFQADGAITGYAGLSVAGGNAVVTNNLTVNGSTQQGDELTDLHGVNTVPEAGIALKVAGGGDSGNYAAKFYLGDPSVQANLAAWIRKK